MEIRERIKTRTKTISAWTKTRTRTKTGTSTMTRTRIKTRTKTNKRTGTRRNIYVTKLNVHKPFFLNHSTMHIFTFNLLVRVYALGLVRVRIV